MSDKKEDTTRMIEKFAENYQKRVADLIEDTRKSLLGVKSLSSLRIKLHLALRKANDFR
ncbi:MAG: hypothetical protein UT53_C0044G0005 [Candidatus Yanofskybacteria bacterium GW2011_GWD2_39_48]|uniref:Uncharacterized protein n=1 Tax=Candidatus Yanofskybacteria bacterium GW2011_GWD2_39_48 TaxID=1619031 RepID=A0A0G0S9E9_9BACT|nr:MAG: hypothetical protein UT53_C0044G0005 [Candidatus Yanofskybacteria bacterium GW2011_GWD2_39_48]